MYFPVFSPRHRSESIGASCQPFETIASRILDLSCMSIDLESVSMRRIWEQYQKYESSMSPVSVQYERMMFIRDLFWEVRINTNKYKSEGMCLSLKPMPYPQGSADFSRKNVDICGHSRTHCTHESRHLPWKVQTLNQNMSTNTIKQSHFILCFTSNLDLIVKPTVMLVVLVFVREYCNGFPNQICKRTGTPLREWAGTRWYKQCSQEVFYAAQAQHCLRCQQNTKYHRSLVDLTNDVLWAVLMNALKSSHSGRPWKKGQ